jgi:APA family basic amino acid/polyamine antiporter
MWFSKKKLEEVIELSDVSKLTKSLTAIDLIFMGLGGIIGAGVFVLTGIIAANHSGPGIMLSYAIAGISCIFVALIYTELASMIPSSGGIYTYSHVALGEIFAWLIFGIITVEYIMCTATVATGWSSYIIGILNAFNVNISSYFSKSLGDGGFINLPAILILLFITVILYLGNRGSKTLNSALVIIKITVIICFVVLSIPHFDIDKWTPFAPFGYDNILLGSSILFFAFTGFSVIATTVEECKNPLRDLKIGIIGSLLIATIIYIIIAGLLTGIVSYTELNTSQPLVYALSVTNNHYGSILVGIGAVVGMITVMMVNLYAQSRICYVLARDKLLPKWFGYIHPKYSTPHVALLIFSAVSMILAGFFPCKLLGQLASMGSLVDYIAIISIAVILRIKLPDVNRPFICPKLFIISPITILILSYLLFKQIFDASGKFMMTGRMFIFWLLVFLIIYIVRYISIKKIKN